MPPSTAARNESIGRKQTRSCNYIYDASVRLGARGFQTRGLRSSSTPHGVLDTAVFLQLRYTTGLRSVSSQGHSPKSLVSRVFMEFDDAHVPIGQGWPLPKAPLEMPLPCSFQLLEVACVPWLTAPSSISLHLSNSPSPVTSHLLLCLPLPLIRTLVIELY